MADTARTKRRLAAILAMDVVGYSRMVEADEAGTLAQLKTLRKEVVEPALTEHAGRIVKLMGDGLLVEFASVVDAVGCAVAIQRAMAARNAHVPAERRIEVRAGVNLGDVVVEGDDLLGDGVNVAARLEGIAEPGGIVISGTAFDQLKGKTAFTCDDLGPQRVKNIAEPVRTYRVRLEGPAARAAPTAKPAVLHRSADWRWPAVAAVLAVALMGAGLAMWRPWASAPPPAPVIAQPPAPPAQAQAQQQAASAPAQSQPPSLPQLPASIAPQITGERAALIVLPFANLSGDPQQEYFSDGITEDITTALARTPGFLVMARNTAFTFKGKAVNAQSVGRELGVRYLLEGSVQKQGARLRLNAQLVETATGNHIWAERFDRPVSDVFIVQDELVDKIVGTVAAHLRRREGERALAVPPERLEAYDLTMRARILRNQGSRDEIFEARNLLRTAVGRDPSYGAAHAYLALVLGVIFTTRWNEEFAAPATAQAMLASSSKAVALEPSNALAHAALGWALLRSSRDFDGALVEADRAILLGGQDSDVLGATAVITLAGARYEQTIEILRKALELDPFLNAGLIGNVMGPALFLSGRLAEATEAAQYCIRRIPTNVLCWRNLVGALGAAGSAPSVRAELNEFLDLSPGYSISEARRAIVTGLRDPRAVESLLDGLRKAGVPE